jgi:O-antigen/teichoic acid export membrane protein
MRSSTLNKPRSAKLGQDVAIVGIANVILQLRGLLLLPIIVKTLGIEAYGVWSQLTLALVFLESIFGLNLHVALIRFVAGQTTSEASEAVWTILSLAAASGLVGSAVMYVLARPLAVLFLGVPDAETIFALGAAAVWFGILNKQLITYFRAVRQTRMYAMVYLAEAFADALFVSLTVWLTQDLNSGVMVMIFIRALLFGMMMIGVTRQVGWSRPIFHSSAAYLRYCIPTLPALLFYWIVDKSDRFLIGYFLGVGAVGIYSATYNLCNVLHVATLTLSQTLFPAITEAWTNQRLAKMKDYLSQSLQYFMMFSLPALAGLVVLSPSLLALLASEEVATTGAKLVPWIGAGILLYGAHVVYVQVFYVTKHTTSIGIISIVAGTLNIVLNLLWIPIWGILGTAISTMVCYAWLLGLTVLLSRRHFQFNAPIATIGKYLAGAAIMYVFLLLVFRFELNIMQLAITISAGATVYFGALLMLQAFSPEELAQIRRGLKSLSRFSLLNRTNAHN